jgi:Domain of unknown function (DUF6321)
MKTFKEVFSEAKKMKGKDPCWKGYEMIGTKEKGGRTVPNCVPKEEVELEEAHKIGDKVIIHKGPRDVIGKVGRIGEIRKPWGAEPRYTIDHDEGSVQLMKHNFKKYKEPVKEGYEGSPKEEVEQVDEVVRKEGSKYVVRSQEGKNLGKFDTEAGAKKRLRQVEYFKHTNEEVEQIDEVAEHGKWLLHPDYVKHIKDLQNKGYSGPHHLINTATKMHQSGTHMLKVDPETGSVLKITAEASRHPQGMTKTNPTGIHWQITHHVLTGPEAKGITHQLKSMKEEVITERGADSKGYFRPTEKGAGLTPKGAKHFGIHTAVTTKPSKLKKNSKSWKRRKSFCARMSGMKGPMKDEKGRPTRKAMSLRRWNC